MIDSQGHILVVMADPHLGALLDRTLRAADFTVTLMQDGSSAVKQAGMLDASLVILGERLRDGAGLDCAAEFSRRLPALPLLLVANQESSELVKRAMRAGISDFLCP